MNAMNKYLLRRRQRFLENVFNIQKAENFVVDIDEEHRVSTVVSCDTSLDERSWSGAGGLVNRSWHARSSASSAFPEHRLNQCPRTLVIIHLSHHGHHGSHRNVPHSVDCPLAATRSNSSFLRSATAPSLAARCQSRSLNARCPKRSTRALHSSTRRINEPCIVPL